MSYTKAHSVLPQDLLKEIQKHIQGEFIYIPKAEGVREKWGQNSGAREYLSQRNEKIYKGYLQGSTIDQLATDFCLSHDSIKKIIYKLKKGA